MFTGIIQAVGRIEAAQPHSGDVRLVVDATPLAARVELARLAVGESIAVNGVCLTVVSFEAGRFVADVSRETLQLTTLGQAGAGTAVNLEAALCMGDPLGGHLLSGHVDGIARVVGLQEDARSLRVRVEVPPPLAQFIAAKGSVALDGVSLTVNEAQGVSFGINLVPHTLEATTLHALRAGMRLNLEVDMIARYVRRMLAG